MTLWMGALGLIVAVLGMMVFAAFRRGIILENSTFIEELADPRRFALVRTRLLLSFFFALVGGLLFASSDNLITIPLDPLVLVGTSGCLMASIVGTYLLEGLHRGQMEIDGFSAKRGDLDFWVVTAIFAAASLLFGGFGLFAIVKGLS